MANYTLIEKALQAAGLLAEDATEAQFAAVFQQVCQTLSTASSATGVSMTEGQIATAIANNTLFAERIAESIRATRTISVLGATGRNAVIRMLSQPIRTALVSGGRAGFALLSWEAFAALILILGAIGVGTYMYTNWGQPSIPPVQLGPRFLTPVPTDTPTEEPTATPTPTASPSPNFSNLTLSVDGQVYPNHTVITKTVGSQLTLQAQWDGGVLDGTGWYVVILEQGDAFNGNPPLAKCSTGSTCTATDTRSSPIVGRIYDVELHDPTGAWRATSNITLVNWISS
jgi:hypothetical protein